MVILIAGTILLFLLLFLVLLVFYRTSRHRKKALFVMPIRTTIKILAPLIGLLAIGAVMNFPLPLLLIGYILCFVLVPFSIDIIIKREGIYFGLKLIPWERIKSISNHSLYLLIVTNRKLEQKGFLKVIWKISNEDIGRIQSLFRKRKAK